jgi:aminoglycoside phosphotransferase (APT) family kinase protein
VTEPWAPERVVDAEAAHALIAEQFPDLAGARVEPMGIGFDNTAYLVDGAWVFRFPRRAVTVAQFERETRLLPWLAPRVPLLVPVPERIGRASERYPWPFAGYRRLQGRTACTLAATEEQRASMAEPVARFLSALHALPVDEAVALGAEGDTIGRMDMPMRAPRARARLAELHGAGMLHEHDVRRLEQVMALAPVAAVDVPVLVHGDLYARHLIADDECCLAGVIDWGDVHLGDRAVDLALAHTFLPPGARAAFRRAYGDIPPATWARAGARAVQHAALLARYARHAGDEDLLREATLALRWTGDDA